MAAAIGHHAAPKPRKVIHWQATGTQSLNQEATAHHTTADEMLRLAKAEHHHYGPAMDEYVHRGDFNARLPHGTVLFAYAT
jgi:hypothetical protein